MSLKITNIQDFSLHDGPGIRTTIFLAGCPLNCSWCHNPEAKTSASVLIYDAKNCINCKACTVCPENVHTFEPEHNINRKKCMLCGKCISACPSNALSFSVRELSDDDFFKIVHRQIRLCGNNGGITFSGGEPLMQGEKLLALLKKADIHTAVETCGHAPEKLFKKVIEAADYVMFDIKIADAALHKKYTGVSNEIILKNLEMLRRSSTPFELRTPLIPGITDTEENLSAIKEIVCGDKWQTLEYNTLTPSKYERIGEEYTLLNLHR